MNTFQVLISLFLPHFILKIHNAHAIVDECEGQEHGSGVESSSECVPPCLTREINHRVVIRTPLVSRKHQVW